MSTRIANKKDPGIRAGYIEEYLKYFRSLDGFSIFQNVEFGEC